MIRRLIILLLIVGCVFGDTIVYKKSIFISDTLNNVVLINSDIKEGICYSIDNKIDCLSCQSITSIIDSSNNYIDFECDVEVKGELINILKKIAIPTGVVFLFIMYVSSHLI